MRVHVTGSRGFIAGHLLAELDARGHDATGSDVEHALAPELIIEPDLQGWAPELVIHAGALVGRELRGMGTQRAIELNVTSTAILANACAGLGIPLVYLSTSEVYGARVDGSLAFESDELIELPHNLYGLTKRWGEEACRLAFRERLELLTIARLSMPYGPGHPPGAGRAALTNFLWAAMRGEPLVVHRGARRSWCWIGDTARAIVTLSEHAAGRSAVDFLVDGFQWREPMIVNVGRDDNECDMLDVAELALSCVRNDDGGFGDLGELGNVWDSSISLVDPPDGFTLVKRLDVSRMRELGWTPTVGLAEGIELTYRWLREKAPVLIG